MTAAVGRLLLLLLLMMMMEQGEGAAMPQGGVPSPPFRRQDSHRFAYNSALQNDL